MSSRRSRGLLECDSDFTAHQAVTFIMPQQTLATDNLTAVQSDRVDEAFVTTESPFMTNQLLKDAVHANALTSKQGMLERLFTLAFSGLVYPQIWEDPEVDMAALDLGSGKRILTIASGGCNVMSYLTASPAGISAVDLNPAHVALVKLKIAAIKYLPDYESFFRFFGHADEKANTFFYDRYIRDQLDPTTRAYWEHKRFGSGRRINLFARNVYRYGLLGRFIGTVHVLARAYGKNPRRMLSATSLDEPRRATPPLQRDAGADVRHKARALALQRAGLALWSWHPPGAIRLSDCPGAWQCRGTVEGSAGTAGLRFSDGG
jgi:hypothetical protein